MKPVPNSFVGRRVPGSITVPVRKLQLDVSLLMNDCTALIQLHIGHVVIEA